MSRELFVEVVPNFPLIHMPTCEDYFQIPLQVAEQIGMDVKVLADTKYIQTSNPLFRRYPLEFHKGPMRVLRRLRSLQPAMVHAQSVYPAAYLAGAVAGSPAFFTPHGLMNDPQAPLHSKIQVLEHLMAPLALRSFIKVICVSQHEYEGYRRRGFANLALLPNPIDYDYLSTAGATHARDFRKRHNIHTEFVLVHISTLWEIKNPTVIVQAHHELRKRGLDTTLVMAGPLHFRSQERDRFRTACVEAGKVVLPGQLDFPQIREALAAADACVISSDWETQCIVAYEAAAAGVPLFLSSIPTLQRTFGPLATYHPPRDPQVLADNLEGFLLRQHKRKRKLALQAFAKKHSITNYCRHLRQMYQTCLRQ